MPLPFHLISRDGLVIDDFDYEALQLPQVTDAIKEKAALIANVPLYGVSHCAIEDIEMAVAIIEMVNLAEDFKKLENLSNSLRHVVTTLAQFQDLLA